MKRIDDMALSTIHHYIRALARCFDWIVRSGSPLLAVNALHLRTKRYATYQVDKSKIYG